MNYYQRALLRALMLAFGHLVEAENAEILSSLGEPVIFVFNHNSSYETVFVAMFLLYKRQGRKVSFIIDWMYRYIPVIGWFLKQIDPIYVYNKKAKIKSLNRMRSTRHSENVYQACIERLINGHSVALFPEGSRNKNPKELKKGRRGIGEIVIQTNVPVLPIGIDFPSRVRRNKIPKFGRLILRIGETLDFSKERAEAQLILNNEDLSAAMKRRSIGSYKEHIIYSVMSALATLSRRTYPFPPPQILSKVKRSVEA